MDGKNTKDGARHHIDEFVVLRNYLKGLREMKDIPCSDGTWDYDPYMHGMANGMIFVLSLFDDKTPGFLEALDQWLEDLPDTELK